MPSTNGHGPMRAVLWAILYATPFQRIDRYVPQGTPIQVSERLAERSQPAATAFNLIIPDE